MMSVASLSTVHGGQTELVKDVLRSTLRLSWQDNHHAQLQNLLSALFQAALCQRIIHLLLND
jgi:hypothetical protein